MQPAHLPKEEQAIDQKETTPQSSSQPEPSVSFPKTPLAKDTEGRSYLRYSHNSDINNSNNRPSPADEDKARATLSEKTELLQRQRQQPEQSKSSNRRGSFESTESQLTLEDDDFVPPYAIKNKKTKQRGKRDWNCFVFGKRNERKIINAQLDSKDRAQQQQQQQQQQESGIVNEPVHRLHRLYTIKEVPTAAEVDPRTLEEKRDKKKRLNWFTRRKKRVKMSAPLSIRNLSSKAVTLVSIERFDTKQQETGAFMAVSRVANNVWNATTSANETAIVKEGMKSTGTEELSVRADSFTLIKTDRMSGPNDVLRLTIDIDGSGRYTADVPSPKEHSNVLTPIDGATGEYSTIYIKEDNLLAILPNPQLSSWMTPLADNLPLSALSLPGTHNSPTHYTALPSVRCQVASPAAQLENGVRFFDIRVQPPAPTDKDNTNLTLVHGVFPISLTGAKYLRDLLKDVKEFLAKNPGETVMLCLRREGVGEHTDAQLSTLLRTHYLTDTEPWFLEPRVPRLGEARGKMVLMRRYGLDDETKALNGGQGIGINAEGWANNTRCDEREHVVVQDFYAVMETEQIESKIDACRAFLDRSGSSRTNVDDVQPLHLNFLSASNFWRVGCWPDKIAAKLNPAVTQHLCLRHVVEKEGDGCTGIVVCDWVGNQGDWDLVRCIVGMNGKIGV